MAKQETIELTLQEIEDIKDTAKFRAIVVKDLKRLQNIPERVNSLRTQAKFQWALLTIILASILAVGI